MSETNMNPKEEMMNDYKEFREDYKDFTNKKANFNLDKCPKCNKPLTSYTEKPPESWNQYLVCHDCKMAEDISR